MAAYLTTGNSSNKRLLSSLVLRYIKLKSGIERQEACSQAWETGFIRFMPSPYYPASVLFFQLHGGMVRHLQVLATPSSTVHNTKYLDPYH